MATVETPSEKTTNLYVAACGALTAKHFEKAQVAFEELKLHALSENSDIWTNDLYQFTIRQLGLIELELGNNDTAFEYFCEGQAFFPDDIDIYSGLTYTARKQKNWKWYLRALRLYLPNVKGVMIKRIQFHQHRLNNTG